MKILRKRKEFERVLWQVGRVEGPPGMFLAPPAVSETVHAPHLSAAVPLPLFWLPKHSPLSAIFYPQDER
jgi:hypothetical protein